MSITIDILPLIEELDKLKEKKKDVRQYAELELWDCYDSPEEEEPASEWDPVVDFEVEL